jgi:hypothetical protein
MEASIRFGRDSVVDELECARQIVRILFETTGLATIVANELRVIVGGGNWISFTAGQALSSEAVFRLQTANGGPVFVADEFNRRGRARSTMSPSLHLMNLDSGQALRGHVDAHYWPKNPLGHAGEFFTKKTAAPSDLLKRLQN